MTCRCGFRTSTYPRLDAARGVLDAHIRQSRLRGPLTDVTASTAAVAS